MSHEQTAVEIARDIRKKRIIAHPVKDCGRQGDLLLVRTTRKPDGEAKEVPESGTILAAGVHGEHRLVPMDEPLFAIVTKSAVWISASAAVVHTDHPEGRHEALMLPPGTWKRQRERELTVDEAVVNVSD